MLDIWVVSEQGAVAPSLVLGSLAESRASLYEYFVCPLPTPV